MRESRRHSSQLMVDAMGLCDGSVPIRRVLFGAAKGDVHGFVARVCVTLLVHRSVMRVVVSGRGCGCARLIYSTPSGCCPGERQDPLDRQDRLDRLPGSTIISEGERERESGCLPRPTAWSDCTDRSDRLHRLLGHTGPTAWTDCTDRSDTPTVGRGTGAGHWTWHWPRHGAWHGTWHCKCDCAGTASVSESLSKDKGVSLYIPL